MDFVQDFMDMLEILNMGTSIFRKYILLLLVFVIFTYILIQIRDHN